MTQNMNFSYRLPLTYVRITGTRTATTDGLSGRTTVECTSAVTTEIGADLLSRCAVVVSPEKLQKQKAIWSLTEDRRLTGADVTTTAEPLAGWKTGLSAGAFVLSAGIPLVVGLGLGPPGWITLAGAAGLATVGGGLASGGFLGITGGDLIERIDGQPPPSPAEVVPAEWDVDRRYVEEKPREAKILAGYRATLAEASAAHATAVRAALDDSQNGDPFYWEKRVKSLERILLSATVGAAQAEAAYAAWKAGKVTTVTKDRDERLRIDVLPDRSELRRWAANTGHESAPWKDLAEDLRVAVSVELEHLLDEDNQRKRLEEYTPSPATDDVIHYRQPRPAVVETWKLTPHGPTAYELDRVEVRRILVAYPGNEATMQVRPDDDASSAVALTFAESGALTKISAERTDPALQRAQDIQALIPALKDAAEAGSGFGAALSPPSLVDRAAEAKAARELGLLPTPDDPLKELKEQVAEQELRARLRLAEQMAKATSPPVFVTVRQPATE